MTTLDRIEQLMTERGWTRYQLAKECKISLSTISNMYKRHTVPTLTTIETICKAFGITLSQFFDFGEESNYVHLSDEQRLIFDRWACLTPEQKELFFKFVDNMK